MRRQPEALAQRRIAGEPEERLRRRLDIMRSDQKSLDAVAHDIAAAGHAGGDDRPARRRRLDQAAWNALAVPGEQHRDVMLTPDPGNVGGAALPADTGLCAECLKL